MTHLYYFSAIQPDILRCSACHQLDFAAEFLILAISSISRRHDAATVIILVAALRDDNHLKI